jgi:hypothetical protein
VQIYFFDFVDVEWESGNWKLEDEIINMKHSILNIKVLKCPMYKKAPAFARPKVMELSPFQ